MRDNDDVITHRVGATKKPTLEEKKAGAAAHLEANGILAERVCSRKQAFFGLFSSISLAAAHRSTLEMGCVAFFPCNLF
ncbi:MAG: hypothetical protein HOP19_10065 [Acidobacteria bacterium]|nr:hypothetical protein [Acidobacteriota bacterium]